MYEVKQLEKINLVFSNANELFP